MFPGELELYGALWSCSWSTAQEGLEAFRTSKVLYIS